MTGKHHLLIELEWGMEKLMFKRYNMEQIARVSEIIAASPASFEDAIKAGFKRANLTLRGITGLRILEQRVSIKDEKIDEYRVRLEVIFVLEN